MKKMLLIVLVGLFSFQSFGQDPVIYDTWYLHEYHISQGSTYHVSGIVPFINPTLIITETLDFSGEGACNTFDGSFTYNNTTDRFTVTGFIDTTLDCGITVHNDFEDFYFETLKVGSIFQIEYASQYEMLIITDELGNVLYFRRNLIQNPDFFQTWYTLGKYSEEYPYQSVSDVNPPINPSLTVTESLTFSGQGACNTFSGTLSYYIGIYTVESFSRTSIVCDYQSHIDFENSYFEYFNVSNIFSAGISDGSFDIQYLDLGSPIFYGWEFSTDPFPVPSLFETWYLSRIEYVSGDIIDIATILPAISPELTIYPSLEMEGFGDCNSFGGNFEYDATAETLTTFDYYETLFICEGDSTENIYFNFFRDEMPLGYQIENFEGNIKLVLEHPILDYILIFQETPLLATSEFTLNDIKIYPNPVSDQLFISSENNVIESITVYSISGQRILEVINETNSIDVSTLSKGIYFIELSSSEGKSVQKFIKN